MKAVKYVLCLLLLAGLTACDQGPGITPDAADVSTAPTAPGDSVDAKFLNPDKPNVSITSPSKVIVSDNSSINVTYRSTIGDLKCSSKVIHYMCEPGSNCPSFGSIDGDLWLDYPFATTGVRVMRYYFAKPTITATYNFAGDDINISYDSVAPCSGRPSNVTQTVNLPKYGTYRFRAWARNWNNALLRNTGAAERVVRFMKPKAEIQGPGLVNPGLSFQLTGKAFLPSGESVSSYKWFQGSSQISTSRSITRSIYSDTAYRVEIRTSTGRKLTAYWTVRVNQFGCGQQVICAGDGTGGLF